MYETCKTKYFFSVSFDLVVHFCLPYGIRTISLDSLGNSFLGTSSWAIQVSRSAYDVNSAWSSDPLAALAVKVYEISSYTVSLWLVFCCLELSQIPWTSISPDQQSIFFKMELLQVYFSMWAWLHVDSWPLFLLLRLIYPPVVHRPVDYLIGGSRNCVTRFQKDHMIDHEI